MFDAEEVKFKNYHFKLQTPNFKHKILPQFAAEFFLQVFDDGVDRGLDVGIGQGPFFGTED